MADYVPIPEPTTPSAMGALTVDQQTLILAQRQEASSRATLVQALCRMGRFDEALSLAPEDGKALIQAYIDAEAAPDNEKCDCVRTHDVTDYTRSPNAKVKLERVNNYSRRFRHWSSKMNATVWHYVCLDCGHRNTVPDDVAMNPELAKRDAKDEALAQKRKDAYEAERGRIVAEVLAERELVKQAVSAEEVKPDD